MSDDALRTLIEGIHIGKLSRVITSTDELSRDLYEFAMKVNPNTDPMVTLATIPTDTKRQAFATVRKYICPCKKERTYRPCDARLYNYDIDECSKCFKLDCKKKTHLCLKVGKDFENPFVEDMYLEVTTSVPEIHPSFNPATIPNYDPDKVEFFYTKKPGIRLFKDYTYSVEGADVQTVQWEKVNHYDKELMGERLEPYWNTMIGHDIGQKVDFHVPGLGVTLVKKVKLGYQTKKHVQEGLHLYVPLLFHFSEDELNMSAYREKTMQITGHLICTEQLVKAQFNNGVEESIEIPVAPLKVTLRVVKNIPYMSEELVALKLNLPSRKFIHLMEVDKYPVFDLDEKLKIKGSGIVEAFGVYLVPKTYEDDFYKWDLYQEVNTQCVQEPIIINDPDLEGNPPSRVAVQSGSAHIPTNPLKEIGLVYEDDTEIKKILPVDFYNLVDKYKQIQISDCYRPKRVNGLMMFFINSLYETNYISLVYNLSGLKYPSIEFKFRDDLVDGINNELVKCGYEFRVLRFHLNTVSEISRSAAINHIQR